MNDHNSSQNNQANIAISKEVNATLTHYSNVDQNVITITEDKVRLALINYVDKLEDKKLWIAPLGIFITLILIPLTTEKFKDAFLIPASVWQAICYIGIFGSLIWFMKLLYRLWRNRTVTINSIINELKKGSKNTINDA